jgi:hypothetical protein
VASLACRGGSWVIAGDWASESSDAGQPSNADAATPAKLCPTVAALDAEREANNPAPAVDARFAGVWRGNLGGGAAAGFPSADVELRITGGGQNSLLFGAPDSAPVVVEPTRGYLCSETADGVRCGTPSGYVGGFSYPLEAVMTRGDILSFRIVSSDPWDGWCRLQAPQPRPDQTQACGYAFGAGPLGSDRIGATGCARVADDGSALPIDCELMYALQRCRCAADACVAQASDSMEVGLRLSDGLLIGSLWYRDDVDAAGVSLARP